MAKVFKRRFKANSTSVKRGKPCYRFICSGNGRPTLKSAPLVGTENYSTTSRRCGCQAKILFWDGNFTVDNDHAPECLPFTDDELRKHFQPTYGEQIDALFPGLLSEVIDLVDRLSRGDLRLKPRNLRAQIEQTICDAFDAKAASSTDEEKAVINGLRNIPSRWLDGIIAKGRAKALDGIPVDQSFYKLLETLQSNSDRFAYNIYSEGELISAVHMHMKCLSSDPDSAEAIQTSQLFMCDVTHAVSDSRAGPSRMSTINVVTGSHKLLHGVVSLLAKEDTGTFMSEAHFLSRIIPGLMYSEPIFIVDGDRGRISALRNIFPACRIFLCLWHKEQNVQSRAGSAVRAQITKADGDLRVSAIKALLKTSGVEFTKFDTKNMLLAKLEEARANGLIAEVTPSDENARSNRAQSNGEPGCMIGDNGDEHDEEENVLPDKEQDQGDDVLPEGASTSRASTSHQVLPKNYNFASAKVVFRYIRQGKDRQECEQRLEEAAKMYPSVSAYLLGECKSTMQYWADFMRVWGTTFGLTSTSIQESFHWSIKSQLMGNSVFPHQFPDFFVAVFEKRLNAERRCNGSSKTNAEQAMLSEPNFSNLCQTHLTSYGADLVFSAFGESSAYQVASELVTLDELRVVLEKCPRTASTLRFAQISELEIASSESQIQGRYFQVQRRSQESHRSCHVVHVFSNGALACTCGEFAVCGLPCKHIMCVFRESGLLINVKAHIHPHFIVPITRTMPTERFSSLTVHSTSRQLFSAPIPVSSDATWDYAIRFTAERWAIVGEGRMPLTDEQGAVLRPTTHVRHAESKADVIFKEFRAIMPFIGDPHVEGMASR